MTADGAAHPLAPHAEGIGASSAAAGACSTGSGAPAEGLSSGSAGKPSPVPILFVDDDPLLRAVVSKYLRRLGYAPEDQPDGRGARAALAARRFAVAIVDLLMPGEDGISLLSHIRAKWPDMELIAVTGFADEEKLASLQEIGVSALITKPFTEDQLRFSLLGALRMKALHDEARGYRARLDEAAALGDDLGLVGVSEAIRELRRKVLQAARLDLPVLIHGESGTGKELIASAIHRKSGRAVRPLFTIDCAGIAPSLVESELFGHARGAFTGAHEAKDGLLSAADGGTVFHDEIGELPLDIQAKFLRVLEAGEVKRLGEMKPRSVDLRVICATNRNLEKMIGEGAFRKDLFFRVRGLSIEAPSLRDHSEDIPYLAHHFLTLVAVTPPPPGPAPEITSGALEMLQAYDWPGNVRELRHLIAACRSIASQGRITEADVAKYLPQGREMTKMLAYRDAKRAALERFERAYFARVLHRAAGCVRDAATLAGMHEKNLRTKLKQLGVRADEFQSENALDG